MLDTQHDGHISLREDYKIILNKHCRFQQKEHTKLYIPTSALTAMPSRIWCSSLKIALSNDLSPILLRVRDYS